MYTSKNYKEINEALDESRVWKLIRQDRDPKATPLRMSLLPSRDEEVTSASLLHLLLNDHLCLEAVHQDASQAIRRHMDTHSQSVRTDQLLPLHCFTAVSAISPLKSPD